MKLDQSWRRIAGIHIEDNGDIAAVWLAHDKDADCVHLYDCAVFRREVMAVIAEGLNARGRAIPLAWEQSGQEVIEKLKERGCKVLSEGYKDTPAVSEVTSRDLWERMRTGRFKVDRRNAEWLDEYRNFYREDGQVPQESFPLMSATRHAIGQLKKAAPLEPARKRIQYDNAGII